MTQKNDSTALIEFAFVSRFAAALEPCSIARLARQTWRHNIAAGLTGEMVIDGVEVQQVVEGRVDAVLPLASRILSDQRHNSIRVIALGPISQRRHAHWRVAGLPETVAAPVADGAANATVVPLAFAAEARAPRAARTASGAA
jgi:hypothetical protein